ncbi:ribonuclease III [Phormidium tenue FACHB-886]|nr:ribonuclease III [Phormidium tenue FACHB-886]
MFVLPPFRDRALLQQALTHRSYLNEHPEIKDHNERLEFLGDAVLNFLSGEFLYERFPEKPEGELTPLRSILVNETQLAKFAELLNLGNQLRLGRGAALEGGRQNANLLSSAFEAVIGAYLLDNQSDIQPMRHYIHPFFEAVVDRLTVHPPTANYKSRLQEWALAQIGESPSYVIVQELGPDHAKERTAEVRIGGEKYGDGKGRSKQDAEKEAARDALEKLGLL